ncbi:metallophosphoesterase [bacterium]|nr:metallophosphoesterase [bacterium]
MNRFLISIFFLLLGGTDITFFAMGDPQYGGGQEDKNDWQIAAMNTFPGSLWGQRLEDGSPTAFMWVGEPVRTPLGVLIAGDLTQNGQDGRWRLFGETNELGRFLEDYGLDGTDGKLHFPVYEGTGNHDFDTLEDWWYGGDAPAVEAVRERMLKRFDLLGIDTDGHYTWVWEGVHFLQLNLYPGRGPRSDTHRDPQGSLAFLESVLLKQVAGSGRPVVLIHHYGFDTFSTQDRWWTESEREEYAEVIKGYNIVAIIHGHVHNTRKESHYQWKGYDVYNVGTPFGEQGHFTVFRIKDGWLQAGDVAWTRDDPERPTTEWHTWSHTKPISMGSLSD